MKNKSQNRCDDKMPFSLLSVTSFPDNKGIIFDITKAQLFSKA
ncbi:hypothetical protein HMPREF2534_03584 [Bacteroides thetaiotaomicron]|nr:hypothetical protein HMPREF2534_03584 [Bacteroides thetaiotaomicron]